MSFAFLGWLTDHRALMALLQANELQGRLLVAAVIFCETGLVVLPFLPGDSILFAVGAFVGLGGHSPLVPIAALAAAAIVGDAVNFEIGRSRVGRWVLARGWISEAHLVQTRAYFDRYGGFTITIGRFVPIVRTIAPFVAGMTGMDVRRFVLFNALGGVLWTSLMLLAGYWLGRIPWVEQHLTWLSVAIIAVSVVPVGIQAWQARARRS